MTTHSTRLTIGLVISLSTILISTPSFAGFKYTSKGGKLTIQYGNACSTVKPTGSYRFSDGTAGDLTAVDCSRPGGDSAEHKFRDKAGKERCYGRMTQYWGQTVKTVWAVEGAVSGYSCSLIGKKFEVEMDSGQQN